MHVNQPINSSQTMDAYKIFEETGLLEIAKSGRDSFNCEIKELYRPRNFEKFVAAQSYLNLPRRVVIFECDKALGQIGSPCSVRTKAVNFFGLNHLKAEQFDCIFLTTKAIEICSICEIEFFIGHELGHLTPLGELLCTTGRKPSPYSEHQRALMEENLHDNPELEFYCDRIGIDYVGDRDLAIAALDRLDEIVIEIAISQGLKPYVKQSSKKLRIASWPIPTELRVEIAALNKL